MSVGAEVRVRNLCHTFASPDGPVAVLDDLDVDVPAGGYASIMGPSGAGKSTLLSVLGGLERPQSGSVFVAGRDLAAIGGDALAAFRRETVGFVFQHFGLLEPLTAEENVQLACTLAGRSRPAGRERARELLAAVGLSGRARHRPPQLSGGERQRVAIARALANEPALVLADEPTGNLDEDSSVQVIELLERLPAERGCTIVVVTHNRRLARRAPLRLRLLDGRMHRR